ncbi:hypothetical protein RND81_06G098700 [Saponaria officinalis]|uniref:Uncharacterized protein n=1 Tax=Saponaria officinalis TaxID=3572 RepID=A0AAW1KA19_SAPOF
MSKDAGFGFYGTIVESRNAIFVEEIFPLKFYLGPDLTFDAFSHEDNDGSSLPRIDTSSEPPLEPRRSKRSRVEKSFVLDVLMEEDGRYLDNELVDMYIVEEDPKTYSEATRSVHASLWKEAIDSEIESIMPNHI